MRKDEEIVQRMLREEMEKEAQRKRQEEVKKVVIKLILCTKYYRKICV